MCENHIHINEPQKDGSKLAHGEVHEEAHLKSGRRSFLKGLGITGGMGLLLGNMPVHALSSSPLSMMVNGGDSDRILVMIRLKGGNDGLNTVVPLYDYSTYNARRPQLAISQSETINLTSEYALHPQLNSLMPMWNDGKMKIVNGVGYEDHNLSHFRSTDIITSSSDANEVVTSGWLGRHLDDCFPDFLTNPPDYPPAIQISGAGSILFNGGMDSVEDYSLSVSSPEQLFEIAQTGRLYELDNLPECTYGEQLGFIRTVANATFRYAELIKEKYDEGSNAVNYATSLGRSLGLVARLIKGGLKTQFYVVTLEGFDTHADQANNHANLMNNLSEAVTSFFEDLQQSGRDEDVLAMTFSEFGRRVEENASRGTDHGTASPTMLFGPALNGNGFIGDGPDLNDLDNNENLKFNIDFRQIYATVLENWLCIDPNQVNDLLFRDFDRLDLGLSCDSVSTYGAPIGERFDHSVYYDNQGRANIQYTLDNTKYVKLEIYNISGQHVKTLQNGRQSAGTYTLPVGIERRMAMSPFVYRISINGQAYSKTFPLLKI